MSARPAKPTSRKRGERWGTWRFRILSDGAFYERVFTEIVGRGLGHPAFRRERERMGTRPLSRMAVLTPFAFACVAAAIAHFISFEVGNLIGAF